ncbi:MAG: efflux RND transporter permease subunit [Kiritimatiellae bacterium]|jgi:HAE1 family hydrophobic/amphiphilic exporter-1|nr:efflux RND transporter permease subunit [Kiritimatiellia bacterium]
MNISEIFIRKPIMTTLLTVVSVSVFGIYSYTKLPVSSLPDVDTPVMTITAFYPGASPEDMASTVASPIENKCMEINGLEKIISDNQSGYTQLTLSFSLDKTVDEVAPDVQSAITKASSDLPSDMPQQPYYEKDNPSSKPIMYIMVTSESLTTGDLYDYAYSMIGKQLSSIDGVSKVDVYGSKKAVRIKVDPDKIAAKNVSINDISTVLENATVSLPGGSLDASSGTFSLQPQGLLLTAKDYEPLIIKYIDGAPLYLRDVAECVESTEIEKVKVLYGVQATGKIYKSAICLPITRANGANTIAVAAKVRQKIEQLKLEMPGSVTIGVMYDNSVSVAASVNDVQTTIVLALILVVIIIYFFLGRIRETIVPCFVLPIALLGTFSVMKALNYSLDNLSLLALVLSVGFLVDDAIVVLENTVRHIHEDKLNPIAAAIKSMQELCGTVISTSISLIIVFVPIAFMAGVVGLSFREFAMTVIIAISCSTILALTLTPMMCSKMLKPAGSKETFIEKSVNKMIGALINQYKKALTFTLHHNYIAVVLWIVCIAGTFFCFKVLPKDFLPPGDSGAIMGALVTPLGTSSETEHALQDQVMDIVMANTNVQSVLTATCLRTGADNTLGYVIISLIPQEDRPDIDIVNTELSESLSVLSGGMVFLSNIPLLELSAGADSTASGSKYSYELRSIDQDSVYDAAKKMEAEMRQISGVVGVQTSVKLDLPQLTVDIDRDRASSFGITAMQLEGALTRSFSEGQVTTFYTDIDTYKVITVMDKDASEDPADLDKIYVVSPLTGEMIPLGTICKWEKTVGPQSVGHSQQLNSATLSFNLIPGTPLGDVTTALDQYAKTQLPRNVTGSLQGEAQEFSDSMKSLGVLVFVAIFLLYIVLGVLYESYVHPFTILTTLPVAVFGGLGTLVLFQTELNLYAYIGVFMLIGIIAKNGILMVDFAIEYAGKNPGCSSFDAIFNSCIVRFRPILMTGLSTIFGTLPIALGYGADGKSRIPLGLIVVGGMIFAQVITLFVTPGIFLIMDKFSKGDAQKQRIKDMAAELDN